MCQISRRGFMVGCSAAIAGLAGSRFNSLAFADGGSGNGEVLVVLFLRGGMDGLTLVPPIGGTDRGHYEAARPQLAVPASGPGAALPLAGQFGLHPSAAPLLDLYQDGRLAIVQAAGMNEPNRSHFESMEFIELGTPGESNTPTGWLTRHLQSSTCIPAEAIMPTLAMGDLQQTSLRGDYEAVNLASPGSFNLSTGPWLWRSPQRAALRSLYQGGDSLLHASGSQALDAVDVLELLRLDGLSLADGEQIDHLRAYAADGTDVFRVILRRGGGQNLLLLGAFQDGGGEILTPAGQEIVLPAGWNLVELEWSAGAGGGASDGRLLVSVNQEAPAGHFDLDNGLAEIERFRWGAVDGTVSGLPGRLEVDGFTAWR